MPALLFGISLLSGVLIGIFVGVWISQSSGHLAIGAWERTFSFAKLVARGEILTEQRNARLKDQAAAQRLQQGRVERTRPIEIEELVGAGD